MMVPLEDLHYLRLEPEILANPYPFFARLREESPVHREPDYGVYLVSRYDDVVEVDRRPDVFSNIAVATGPFRRLPPLDDLPAWRAARPYADKLIANDPPDHTRHRQVLSRLFTPRRVAGLEPRIRELADELIDGFVEDGEVEWVSRFANVLPPMVIGELLGVPESDAADLKRLFFRNLAEQQPSDDPKAEFRRYLEGQESGATDEVREALVSYFTDALAERRRSGSNADIMGRLANAKFADGEEVPFETLVTMILLLYQAGAESNTNELLTNEVLWLARLPEVQSELCEDRSLIEPFVEEVLRYETPLLGLFRVAVHDTEVGGVAIPRGSILMVLNGSANHDSAHFKDADQFDLHRPRNQPHLSFGHGTHFCMGAPLARLEGRVTAAAVLDRMGEVRFAPRQAPAVDYRPVVMARVPLRLWVAFDQIS